jgi:hypothetical protein
MFAGILEASLFRIDVRGLRVQTRQKLNERTNGRGRMLLLKACSGYSRARVPPPLAILSPCIVSSYMHEDPGGPQNPAWVDQARPDR